MAVREGGPLGSAEKAMLTPIWRRPLEGIALVIRKLVDLLGRGQGDGCGPGPAPQPLRGRDRWDGKGSIVIERACLPVANPPQPSAVA